MYQVSKIADDIKEQECRDIWGLLLCVRYDIMWLVVNDQWIARSSNSKPAYSVADPVNGKGIKGGIFEELSQRFEVPVPFPTRRRTL